MPNYDTPGLAYDSGVFYDDLAPAPSTNKKKMAKVKFSLKDVPDAGVIQECTNLKTALTGNANFTASRVTEGRGDHHGQCAFGHDPVRGGLLDP